jgi:hypothetical protein
MRSLNLIVMSREGWPRKAEPPRDALRRIDLMVGDTARSIGVT